MKASQKDQREGPSSSDASSGKDAIARRDFRVGNKKVDEHTYYKGEKGRGGVGTKVERV